MLNLFCYSGTVSAFAALGGASSTTSVDMSATYLEWAKEIFRLNNILLGAHDKKIHHCFEILFKREKQ